MKKEGAEKKATAGCFVVIALFFLVLGVYQCNEERQAEQKVKTSATVPLMNTAPVRQKQRPPPMPSPRRMMKKLTATLMTIPTSMTLSPAKNTMRNL